MARGCEGNFVIGAMNCPSDASTLVHTSSASSLDLSIFILQLDGKFRVDYRCFVQRSIEEEEENPLFVSQWGHFPCRNRLALNYLKIARAKCLYRFPPWIRDSVGCRKVQLIGSVSPKLLSRADRASTRGVSWTGTLLSPTSRGQRTPQVTGNCC